MPIRNINICRACLAKCKEDKVLFESLKDIFTELTLIQDTTELPKYLCKKCGELLNQFKNFKETCIESDTHLRKAVSNTTLPLLPFELIKIECPAYEAEDNPPEPSTLPLKRKRKPTKKQEALIAQRSSRSKRKFSEEDNAEDVEEHEQLENDEERPHDETEDSVSEAEEHFDEPSKTSKKRPSSKSDSKTPSERPYECSKSNCGRKFADEVKLRIHLKKHDGIDSNICDICEKPLASSRIMLRHRLSHRSLEERLQNCSVCKKTLASERCLKQHMKMHKVTNRKVTEVQKIESAEENEEFVERNEKSDDDERHNDESEDDCSDDEEYIDKSTKKGTKRSTSNKDSEISDDRPYKCSKPKCRRKFKDELRLYVHLREHDGFDPKICDICEKPLASTTFMLRHRLIHRSLEERSLKCSVCKKVFINERSLEHHMKSHKNINDPQKSPNLVSEEQKAECENEEYEECSTIEKADEKETKLVAPSKKGTNEEQKDEKVSENKAFEKSSKIKKSDDDDTEDSSSEDDDKLFEPPKNTKKSQSYRKPQTSVKRPYKCSRPKCKKSFPDEIRLYFHLRKHDGYDPTICDICEKPLASIRFMLRHRLTHRSLEERSQKCKVCNKILLSDRSFEHHMKSHEATKSFICDICGVGCLSGGTLKVHKLSHNIDNKVFQCEQCQKTFGSYPRLYNHIKRIHGRQEFIACNICGTVINKSFIFGHCRNQHTVFTTTENVFQCKICDVKCKTADILKQHAKLHTGVRKYQCQLCPKAFAHSGLLKKHGYFHSGERPVHCDVCGKGFYQKCALNIHMNVHKKQWIAQGVQGITLTKYKQSNKGKAKDPGPGSSDDSSGYN